MPCKYDKFFILTFGFVLIGLFQNCKSSVEFLEQPSRPANLNLVVFAGYQGDGRGQDVPGYLQNNEWILLPGRDGGTPKSGWAIASSVEMQNIYIGGSVQSATDEIFFAGYWKNNRWVDIENGRAGQIEALFTLNGKVYSGGFSSYYESKPGAWIDGKQIALDMGAQTQGAVRKIIGDDSNVVALGRRGSKMGSWNLMTGAWNEINLEVVMSGIAINKSMIFVGSVLSTNGTLLPAYSKDNIVTLLSADRHGTANDISSDAGDIYIGGSIATQAESEESDAGFWKNGIWTKISIEECKLRFGNHQSSKINRIVVNGSNFFVAGTCSAEPSNSSALQPIGFYIYNGKTTVLDPSQNGAFQFFAGCDIWTATRNLIVKIL